MDDLALHYAKQGVGVSLPLQADIYFVELEDYHKAVVSLRKEMDYSEGLLRRLEAREKVVTRMLFGLTVSLIAVFALSATLYLSR